MTLFTNNNEFADVITTPPRLNNTDPLNPGAEDTEKKKENARRKSEDCFDCCYSTNTNDSDGWLTLCCFDFCKDCGDCSDNSCCCCGENDCCADADSCCCLDSGCCFPDGGCCCPDGGCCCPEGGCCCDGDVAGDCCAGCDSCDLS
ncbi:hypothetical protein HA402_013458 [Bradysia odoriphaga]|nr:hypothetical protein HA402_013458 [Bradysia odoriphaga]